MSNPCSVELPQATSSDQTITSGTPQDVESKHEYSNLCQQEAPTSNDLEMKDIEGTHQNQQNPYPALTNNPLDIHNHVEQIHLQEPNQSIPLLTCENTISREHEYEINEEKATLSTDLETNTFLKLGTLKISSPNSDSQVLNFPELGLLPPTPGPLGVLSNSPAGSKSPQSNNIGLDVVGELLLTSKLEDNLLNNPLQTFDDNYSQDEITLHTINDQEAQKNESTRQNDSNGHHLSDKSCNESQSFTPVFTADDLCELGEQPEGLHTSASTHGTLLTDDLTNYMGLMRDLPPQGPTLSFEENRKWQGLHEQDVHYAPQTMQTCETLKAKDDGELAHGENNSLFSRSEPFNHTYSETNEAAIPLSEIPMEIRDPWDMNQTYPNMPLTGTSVSDFDRELLTKPGNCVNSMDIIDSVLDTTDTDSVRKRKRDYHGDWMGTIRSEPKRMLYSNNGTTNVCMETGGVAQLTEDGSSKTQGNGSTAEEDGGQKRQKKKRTRVEDMDPAEVHVCRVADCNKKFAKKYNLRIHERRHRGDLPFMCPKCSKRFMWLSSYERHLRVHESRAGGVMRKSRRGRINKPICPRRTMVHTIERHNSTISTLNLQGHGISVNHLEPASVTEAVSLAVLNGMTQAEYGVLLEDGMCDDETGTGMTTDSAEDAVDSMNV